MPAKRRTRTRPDIKPIQTNYAILTRSHNKTLRALESPAWVETPIWPKTRSSLLSHEPHNDGMGRGDTSAVGKVDNPGLLSPFVSAEEPLTARNPSFFHFSFPPKPTENGHQTPTPLSPVIQVSSDQRRIAALGAADDVSPDDRQELNTDRASSAPSDDAAVRYHNFQRFREHLWKRGLQAMGNAPRPDVLVLPVPLSQPSRAAAAAGSLSPSSVGKSLPVRVVVRSRGRPPFGLKRTFDVDALRATVPEPLPSPKTPVFLRMRSMAPVTANPARDASSPSSRDAGSKETSDPDAAPNSPAAIYPSRSRRELVQKQRVLPMRKCQIQMASTSSHSPLP